MVAAVNMQWLGIAVAALVVVVLLVVLLLRNRGEDERLLASTRNASSAPVAEGDLFVDQPLSRGFEGLGKPVVVAAGPAPGAATALATPEPIDPFAPHDDLFPPAPPQDPPAASAAARPVTASIAAPAAPSQAPGANDAAPLSEIIVTNDHDEVDLTDPEVRAMLLDLARDEVELARVCREQGQTLDAILQLTEAEKVCVALGLDDMLAEVKAMLAELQ